MAMIAVCDRCAEREGVETYTIEGGGSKTRLDLCKTHMEPLVALMDLVPEEPVKAPAKRASRKPRASRVTSIEEIEALKK